MNNNNKATGHDVRLRIFDFFPVNAYFFKAVDFLLRVFLTVCTENQVFRLKRMNNNIDV